MNSQMFRFVISDFLFLLIFVVGCNINPLFGQSDGRMIGQFDHHQDIGGPDLDGSAEYDEVEQTYLVSAGGLNMWEDMDQFHFLWKKIKGDFIIYATVEFIGEGTDPHRKLGIIARDSLTADSRYVDGAVHGDGLTSLQFRPEKGADTDQRLLESNLPTHIELQRSGNEFTFSAARFGENYKSVTLDLELDEEVYAGLFLSSHRGDVVEQAVFSNVRIVIPPDPDYTPYSDYIGSHLEVMDVETGHRKILHSIPHSLQAPNWTPDNQYLIYNEEGLLYKYRLEDGEISLLNTGFADDNNNDHVLSFDGSMMAISHHTGPDRVSTIYTLPVSGSDNPKKITSENSGNSYLHGWSPDASKLIFTGYRNEQYDIWQVDVDTREEKGLTNLSTLDDGSEYTPDGDYIYFNSSRTGTMQIWRMRPDGSHQEQVTFDEYNDWFPHISPDGEWIVYLSYLPDIDPDSHPFYQKIYLRLMPASGGVPRTIAYLFGGQGTINVPSWSPDSKKISFVSNTKLE